MVLARASTRAVWELAARHLAAEVESDRRQAARAVEERHISTRAAGPSEAARERARERGRERYHERQAEEERELAEFGRVLTQDERSARAWQRVNEAFRDYEAEMRVRITAELLATRFALGDGTEVTWGAATVAQHRQRAGLLTRSAAGTLETAARHHAAVRVIEEAGVRCLAEVPAERAA